MKQTAVQWFFQQLTTVDYNCINKTFLQNDNSLSGHNIRKLFKQAKEMEKEQIIDSYTTGIIDPLIMKNYKGLSIDEIRIELKKQAAEYYNETYKNEIK